MSIEALIFDVDGTMADTEGAHRVAFNLAFERYRLGWVWQPSEYRELLSNGGFTMTRVAPAGRWNVIEAIAA